MDSKTLVGAVLGAALVLIGQLFTGWTAYLSNERAMDVKMIEIALGILTAKPDENIRPARKWAVKVLSKYAPVDARLDEDVQRALLDYKLNLGTGGEYRIMPLGRGALGRD